MGCVCCSLSSFISILLHSLERITLCTVCAFLTCCILYTILSVLVMGIGIGFHYCTVQNSVDAMAAAAKAASAIESRRSGGGKVGGGSESRKQEMLRSVGQAVKRGFAHRLGRRDRDMLMPSNNNTVNERILRAINSSLNGTLPQHANVREFVQRFAKPVGRPSTNNTANIQIIARNLNETASLLERGLNDTLSLLKGGFMESPRRTRRDLTDSRDDDMYGNLTDPRNDTVIEVVDYIANMSYFIFESDEIGSNSSSEMVNKVLASESVSPNMTMLDVISRRQNCTLLNFFTMFF